jgi:hypothetical protein
VAGYAPFGRYALPGRVTLAAVSFEFSMIVETL